MKKIDRTIARELEKKQIELFSRGHRGRKTARRYVQLIEAQDILKRGRTQSKRKPKTR